MDEIMRREIPDVDKLKMAFEYVTDAFFEQTQRKLDLARAMNDREAIVKEQIKIEVMKGARGIFQSCYARVRQSKGKGQNE